MKSDFRYKLKSEILIGDGALGTYLYQQGFPVGISYEELNLTKPEVIADIHRRYYDAGARVIETNTFTATREKLAKFGLEHEVEAINRAGVQIARGAVGDDAFVVGAVGSIRGGKRNNVRTATIEADFREQIDVLIDEGVDGILLETFFDVEECLIALRLVRQQSELPVICQFAIEDAGRTTDGYEIVQAFQMVLDAGADMVGLNCRSGPHRMLRTLESLSELRGTPMSVYPNAGIPDYVDGKYTYDASAQYFAENALKFVAGGVHLIGGCCGTTPEHIEAMAKVLHGFRPDQAQRKETATDSDNRVLSSSVQSVKAQQKPKVEVRQLGSPNIVEQVRKRHTVIVELDPPKDLNIDKFIAGAIALKEAGIDALTMADNSLAVTRMSNSALAYLLHDKLGIRPLVHIACRDRNLIGTQSHMMGLHTMGIDHVLAVTGDPAKFGDLPGSSSVYDLTSFEIIRMIKQLNEGISFSGKPLKQKANFVVGAAFNPNVKHLDKAVKRLERKVKAGADYIMTQPVYDAKLVEEIYEATKHLDIPIFVGIMPLASGGNAEYLHNEVPGIQLSDEVRQRMADLRGEEGKAMGVEIAKELLDVVVKYFNGIYLMTPFMAYEMTAELTRYVWQVTGRSDFHLYPLSK